MVLTCDGILLDHKKIMLFVATWVNLEMIVLSEVSQTERQISYDIAYMRNLKKKKSTNELIYKIETGPQT